MKNTKSIGAKTTWLSKLTRETTSYSQPYTLDASGACDQKQESHQPPVSNHHHANLDLTTITRDHSSDYGLYAAHQHTYSRYFIENSRSDGQFKAGEFFSTSFIGSVVIIIDELSL